MTNIRLKELLEANVDPKLVARSKESGKLVYFKTPQSKDAAMKAGTHEDPKAKKGGQPKADAKPNNLEFHCIGLGECQFYLFDPSNSELRMSNFVMK